MSRFSQLDLRLDQGVAIVTLARAEKLNAINRALIQELGDVVGSVAESPEIRAILICGAGRAFSAGADIAEISAMRSPTEFQRFLDVVAGTFEALEALAVPTIAALNGPALGAGCELALACDLRLMAESAVLGVPEVHIGILPGVGGTQRLAHHLPPAVARQMILLGESLPAQECLRHGLVNAVVPNEALLDEALSWARRLAGLPRAVLRAGKLLARVGLAADVHTGMEIERALVGALFESEDRREGMAAFVEKRPPVFNRS